MDIDQSYEYWDAELKHQSKKRLALMEEAVFQTGAIITDRYENKYFKGRLAWRNPLVLKVKLPKGKRWEFILASKVWLARPSRISLGLELNRCTELPHVPLRGNHDNLKIRRRYRVHPENAAYIADYRPDLNGGYVLIDGADIVMAVLDGDLGLII
jgi:hypothetical protein